MADASDGVFPSSCVPSSSCVAESQPVGLPVNDDRDENVVVLKKELERLRRECDTANAYNEDLRRQVEVLSQELIKAKASASSRTSIAVQVTPEDLEAYIAEGNWLVASQKANVSLADCVRAAAEEVTAQAGYVYDEHSGYYYDNTSGYYYNAELSLYYDAKTGIYFYYNAETKSYDFHSQVDLAQVKQAEEEKAAPTETPTEEPAAVAVADGVDEKSLEKPAEDKKDSKSKRRKTRKHKHKERDRKKVQEKPKRSRHSRDSKRSKRLRLSDNRSSRRRYDSDDNDDYRRHHRSSSLTSDSNEDRGTSSLEEGECSGSITDENSIDKIDSESSDNVDQANSEETGCQWPPCIRVIVLETNVEILSVGTLFLVTCTGAVVGREKSADIQLMDKDVSKSHAQFSYDDSEKRYVLKDMGSQNGTLLNGERLSKAKLDSEPEAVKHGDVVQFGSTKLSLHIHKGMDTCDDCEPGLIQASVVASLNSEPKEIIILSKEEKERERKRALKQIKKKFGLETALYTDESVSANDPNYKDRAQVRRKTKGSDNPYEKTEVASVHSAIPAKNKGFKMLEKMGWSTGQSLGKSQAGIVEPITVEASASKVGLGFEGPTSSSSSATQQKKDVARRENWSKAQKRYRELQESRPQADGDLQMQQDDQ